MDVVTDLTSYAVSIIAVVQDVVRAETGIVAPAINLEKKELWTAYQTIKRPGLDQYAQVDARIREIVWASNPENPNVVVVFSEVVAELMDWLEKRMPLHLGMLAEQYGVSTATAVLIPYHWRMLIGAELYQHKEQRLVLAGILRYMPIQVIFCLGGYNKDQYHQRLYQVWNPGNRMHTLSANDQRKHRDWWDGTQNNQGNSSRAEKLLQSDNDLLQGLLQANSPVPFETFFHSELEEIGESRDIRLAGMAKPAIAKPLFNAANPLDDVLQNIAEEVRKAWINSSQGQPSGNAPSGAAPAKTNKGFSFGRLFGWLLGKPKKNPGVVGVTKAATPQTSPLVRARQMKLVGLAFSGGGIRSATFNLGVLQHLAEKGFLPYVDYLSTVSGGGYIGSWLVSWIKEAGSVFKVADRINAKKSSDPMAEEVRPIRWLRMYSNYLTPNASIMSADSWTLGITWLRNTLVNQFILVLLVCTGLSGIAALFNGWEQVSVAASFQRDEHLSARYVFAWGFLALTPACVLAGLGMRAYNKSFPPQSLVNKIGRNKYLAVALNSWALFSALYICAWMFPNFPGQQLTYPEKLVFLLPVAIVGFLGLLFLAILGRYAEQWVRQGEQNQNWRKFWGSLAILFSSGLAATVGWLLLAAVWGLFTAFPGLAQFEKHVPDLAHKLLFTLGPPLVLEVFSIVVVVRMAIMGNLFPDGRREWWGRMGAIKHRFSLTWILLAYAALFALEHFSSIGIKGLKMLLPLVGGWIGIVGFAVKLAYNSEPQQQGKGGLNAREVFIRFAPYLFVLGFVLLNALLLRQVLEPLWEWVTGGFGGNHLLFFLLLSLSLGLLTLVLAWRVGVNEFSLHYFYRNRLVRAFLGATRRRTERGKTTNDFTGFDEKDDKPLKCFRVCRGYHGPYPLLNTALNATVITELDRQDRKAESFLFSPLFCGFDVSPTRSASFNRFRTLDYGYRPTDGYAYPEGPSLGTAMAISGAAVNPNRGHHTSQATAFLLTVFNVRMGWWMGNPRCDTWRNSDPRLGIGHIIKDLVGKSDITADYVCLSDGGHFDNMGLYELVRRRCEWIILSDAEEDQKTRCEGLANAIRRSYIDFGAVIEIDLRDVMGEVAANKTHVLYGTIQYAGETKPKDRFIYIKTLLNGDEPADIKEYAKQNNLFPNQNTSDQFYDEAQFESYRKLGWHSLAAKK